MRVTGWQGGTHDGQGGDEHLRGTCTLKTTVGTCRDPVVMMVMKWNPPFFLLRKSNLICKHVAGNFWEGISCKQNSAIVWVGVVYRNDTWDVTPPKTRDIGPENQWLKDEISFWNGPFLRGDVSIFFGGITPFSMAGNKLVTGVISPL